MNANKIVGLTFLFIGIIFIVYGGLMIYGLMLFSSFTGALSALPGGAAVTGSLGLIMTFAWVMAVITLVTGILCIISAVLHFMYKG